MPMPEQPPGVRRRKLNNDSPCSEYEIYRASDGTVLGRTRRADHGWFVKSEDSEQWILSRGEAPHTRAMFWLDGNPGFSISDGVLIGSLEPTPGENDAATHVAHPVAAPAAQPALVFILTWHPLQFRWEEQEHGYDEAIQVTAAGQTWPEGWTVGVRKGGISPGDRAVLYRQYENRGLVGSGIFTSGVEAREHWDGSGRVANWANVDWDIVLDYEDGLPVEDLRTEIPEVKWDHIQGSGIAVPASAVSKLSDLWARHTSRVIFRSPDEPRGLDSQTFPEGALSQVEVNRYERDPRARKACLDHWGYQCAVCDFSFEEHYGSIGKSYIHVHHITELSKAPPGYRVNPITDLRPVCPNCHAMIHRGTGQALSIDELKQRLLQ